MTNPEYGSHQPGNESTLEERVQNICTDLDIDDETPLAYQKTREVISTDGEKRTQRVYVMSRSVMDLLGLCPVPLENESNEAIVNTLKLMRTYGKDVTNAGDQAVAAAHRIGEKLIAAKHNRAQG